MSIRAYKLIEIKTADDPTFNLSQEWEFAERYGRGLENDGGIVQFDLEDIEEGLKTETLPEWIELLKAVKKDIDKGEGYVEYYCY